MFCTGNRDNDEERGQEGESVIFSPFFPGAYSIAV